MQTVDPKANKMAVAAAVVAIVSNMSGAANKLVAVAMRMLRMVVANKLGAAAAAAAHTMGLVLKIIQEKM